MDDLLAAVLEIYIKEALHADNGKEIVHQHYDNHQAETKGQGQVKLTHKQLYKPILFMLSSDFRNLFKKL